MVHVKKYIYLFIEVCKKKTKRKIMFENISKLLDLTQ